MKNNKEVPRKTNHQGALPHPPPQEEEAINDDAHDIKTRKKGPATSPLFPISYDHNANDTDTNGHT